MSTIDPTNFPFRLREALRYHGWTARRLRDAAYLGESTVSHLLNNDALPRLSTALAISEVVGFSLDALCGASPLGWPDIEQLAKPSHLAGSEWGSAVDLLCKLLGTTNVAHATGTLVTTVSKMRRPPFPEPHLTTACPFAAALGQQLHGMALGKPARRSG